MTQILAIANQKGGVGKTTTTVNLAASLAAVKRRVLLIDLDPQGNATMGSGVDKNNLPYSVYDVVLGDTPIKVAIQKAPKAGYDVLGANRDLSGAEISLFDLERRELRLKEAIEQIAKSYDFILIDCAPSLSMLTLNALVAADGVIIPMQCEYYALEGLADLTNTIERMTAKLNPRLQIRGIVRTMFDPRNTLANDVSQELIHHFGDKVFTTVIPRNIRLAEAPAHGMPVMHYDKGSRGAYAYLSLAAELIKKDKKEKSSMSTKKRGLGTGRGLDALLGAVRQAKEEVAAVETASIQQVGISLLNLPLEQLQRGRYQPRRDMNPVALQELADSIKAQGVMQPIVVRSIGEDSYEIVAGERRWRAAQMAGLDSIPAIIRQINDDTAMAMALIENIQREDLNPMEQATAMHRFVEEFGLTHQQIAEAVGKARATVSNLLRLMALPREVKTLLEHGDIEMGHARALLALPQNQQAEVARLIVAKGFSVRQTESLVRSLLAAQDKPQTEKRVDPNVADLQQRLADRLGAAVQIDYNKKGQGKLVIRYNSFEELDGILAHIQ